MQATNRKYVKYWLLGHSIKSISSDPDLLTNKKALRVFVYRHLELRETIANSANIIAGELLSLAEIPPTRCMAKRSVVSKLKALYLEYVKVKKEKARLYPGTVQQRNVFIDKLHEIFILEKGEDRPRKKPIKTKKVIPDEISYRNISVEYDSETSLEDFDDNNDEDYETPEKKKRNNRTFAQGAVSSMLDRIQTATRPAAFMVAILASAFGIDIDTIPCSREYLRKTRIRERSLLANDIHDNVDPTDFCTLHWDGKIMQCLDSTDKCDRLAVLATGTKEKEQLLGIPDIASGTGKTRCI